ncbi:hypothetical protein NDU88_006196 [Pleurodeles waltl]|uniref:Uncharacterized protein n=1 Tax=Pleurodeles waltl TaxID=8319 RepID=A0AAV7MYI0_PLEWA|nr:hypothetical protein NDU88_006196 [Pleurodeles waltl]
MRELSEPHTHQGVGRLPSIRRMQGVKINKFYENKVTLFEDITELKCDIAAKVKDLQWDIDDLEQRVDNIERSSDAWEEELETQYKEFLELRDTNMELLYQPEDLKNRSQRANFRIKGVPIRAVPGSLEEYVKCLFWHVAPELAGEDTVLDRTHRYGGTASPPASCWTNLKTYLPAFTIINKKKPS